jgi:hypothetical protein
MAGTRKSPETETETAAETETEANPAYVEAIEKGYFGLDAEDLGADPTDDTLGASDDDRSSPSRPDVRAGAVQGGWADVRKEAESK